MKRLLPLLLCLLLLAGCGGGDHNKTYDNPGRIAGEDQYDAESLRGPSVYGDGVIEASGRMTGAFTVWEQEVAETRTAAITCTLAVTEGGAAKAVLVSPEGAITLLEENTLNIANPAIARTTMALTPGRWRVKVVAQDRALFALEMTVDLA